MLRSLLTCFFITILGTAATASAGGWGPRGGLTFSPDQVHIGIHRDFGAVSRHVRFQPNLEVGFGDNVMVTALNFEVACQFSRHWDVWHPYAGGGVGLNWYKWDAGVRGHSDTDMQTGLNLLGGVEKGIGNGDRLFLEIKLGIADSPDLKTTIGWTFF